MKAVFMGTPDFAVPVLRAMKEAGHDICAVVTQPDKPKGRGKAVQYPPVKECAIEYGIKVYQPARVKEESFVDIIRAMQPEVIVVVAFGQILPQALLDIPEYGCINVHASLLPRWRGAAPIQWSVISGDRESGVTTMLMEAGLDTGDMLLAEKVALDEKETGGSLHDKLSALGADLLLRTLDGLKAGTITPKKQDDSLSCYAGMLTKQLGAIDFAEPAKRIECLIRGLDPWPSAYTSLYGKTLKIWKADVLENLGQNKAEQAPGTVIQVLRDCFYVQTGKGILVVKEVQMEGKKRMDTAAFLRGCNLQEGTMLGEQRTVKK